MGLSEAEARERILAIRHALGASVRCLVRTNTSVSFSRGGDLRTVQVVLRLFRSVAEVLAGFDLDCCCVAYDGARVAALPRARRALARGYNLAGADASRESHNYEQRLLKYALRGFAVACPLAPGWRALVEPRVFEGRLAVHSRPANPGPAEHQLRGFAKLVAWEAALARGDRERLRLRVSTSGGSAAPPHPDHAKHYEYGDMQPFELLPANEMYQAERLARLVGGFGGREHFDEEDDDEGARPAPPSPVHFVFVPGGHHPRNVTGAWVPAPPGDVDALLDAGG